MSDDTTPQDGKAMSPASTGSVGEPLAFAVMQPDSYVVVNSLHSAFAMRDMCGGGSIVPLYRQPQPTLSDAERGAIERAISREIDDEWYGGPEPERAATLRALLARHR